MFHKRNSREGVEQTIAYTAHVSKYEQRDVERIFARLFSTDDGKRVLAWLQVMTFHRAAGIETSDDYLRYMEGQRALVASILRMIDRGKNN